VRSIGFGIGREGTGRAAQPAKPYGYKNRRAGGFSQPGLVPNRAWGVLGFLSLSCFGRAD